jgi:hypothetical protein
MIVHRVLSDPNSASWIQYLLASFRLGEDDNGTIWYVEDLGNAMSGRAAQLVMEMFNKFTEDCGGCDWRRSTEAFHMGHAECESCDAIMPTDSWCAYPLEVVREEDELLGNYSVCYQCYNNGDYIDTLDLWVCERCDALQSRAHGPDEPLCWDCYRRSYAYCEEGDHDVSQDELPEGMDTCRTCLRNTGQVGRICSWDYRPELIFYPDIPQDKAEPLYIGMELEMSWPHVSDWVWFTWIATLPSDLIYCKNDSSVHHGFEAVTHPMQPAWALKNFPFEAFAEAINQGARSTDESTGTHIHMNKEAFTPTLMWKLLQVHYRLPDFIGVIGGRGTSARYGRLKDDQVNGRSGITAQREQLMEIVKKKGGIHDFDRYVALNLRNEYTIEMRYMRGGIDPKEIKKNIEWAQCLYDFIRRITVADVHEGAIDDPGFLLDFIYTGNYPNLAEWIRPTMPQPKRLKARAL